LKHFKIYHRQDYLRIRYDNQAKAMGDKTIVDIAVGSKDHTHTGCSVESLG